MLPRDQNARDYETWPRWRHLPPSSLLSW